MQKNISSQWAICVLDAVSMLRPFSGHRQLVPFADNESGELPCLRWGQRSPAVFSQGFMPFGLGFVDGATLQLTRKRANQITEVIPENSSSIPISSGW